MGATPDDVVQRAHPLLPSGHIRLAGQRGRLAGAAVLVYGADQPHPGPFPAEPRETVDFPRQDLVQGRAGFRVRAVLPNLKQIFELAIADPRVPGQRRICLPRHAQVQDEERPAARV